MMVCDHHSHPQCLGMFYLAVGSNSVVTGYYNLSALIIRLVYKSFIYAVPISNPVRHNIIHIGTKPLQAAVQDIY